MKNAFYLTSIFSAVLLVSCATATQQTMQQNSNSNTAAVVSKAIDNAPLVTSSHGAPQSKPSDSKSSDSAPMMGGNASAIDTTELDAEIAKTEKEYKAKSNDAAAKKALADAYAKRAFALTDAAQYRAALGDFRKCLKLDPENTEAKSMHDQIISIFQSMNREPPAEGAEPSPLPFKKGA